MDNRRYNIFFHLHTVSGISISLLLFVIFFCGAFALFRKELYTWETVQPVEQTTSFHTKTAGGQLRRLLNRKDIVPGSQLSVYFDEGEQSFRLLGLANGKKVTFRQDANGRKLPVAPEYTGTILLYWLHFFWQFGRWGYCIAGAVSLLFFLAICTGVWIHWGKIRSGFFVFRTWVKPKQMWTDLHTALGVIGLPFQFLYALTGSMFGLGILITLVSSNAFYKGSAPEFYKEVFPIYSRAGGAPNTKIPDIAAILELASERQPTAKWERIEISQLMTDSCYISFHGAIPSRQKIAGRCDLVFDTGGKLIHELSPADPNYLQAVPAWMTSWHYADFRLSGWTKFVVRICWFVLAMASCVVIVSGILIWEKAREKKKMPLHKLRFNRTLVRFFLAVSYAFLPAAPLILAVQRVLNRDMGETFLNFIFLLFVVVFATCFWFLPDHRRRFLAALACMFGTTLFMPLLTRIYTAYAVNGNTSLQNAHLFFADLFWIFLVIFSGTVLLWWRIRVVKNPVDHL